jgi:hypothetical protein
MSQQRAGALLWHLSKYMLATPHILAMNEQSTIDSEDYSAISVRLLTQF